MSRYILDFGEVDATKIAAAGGKGANLGELSRMGDIRVPDGFCITTEAFRRVIAPVSSLLDQLSQLRMEDRDTIRELSSVIRGTIEGMAVPEAVASCVRQLGEEEAYAIRSSATAEDLPAASFAGQHDSYLNVIGQAAILEHIRKCWASLFTERAIVYRMQNGFDHRAVYLAVVVQKMVFAKAAGILFTADPVSANRKIVSIDAGLGLGDALVSGRVNADLYTVREGRIIDRQVRQEEPVLRDEQMLELERIGRKIEGHFGSPQDIEWCLADDQFYIVQSRPITTLFPIPDVDDSKNHVYISVGHQQMMTDPIKPLGMSVWQLTAGRPMYTAGGRPFVDVADNLATTAGRHMLLNVLGKSDPLIKEALITILEREGFISPDEDASDKPVTDFSVLTDYAPSVVGDLIRRSETAIAELKRNIRTKSGTELLDFILEDARNLRRSVSDPQSFGVIMTGMNASAWINEKMQEWLGEKNAADTLSQSVANNITSEMGLELLDVADVIRPYPQIIEYLQQAKEGSFLDGLAQLEGGQKVRDAIDTYLDKYGMRCAGEIDITRPRWSEKPATLVPLILSNIKNCPPDAGKQRFEQGLQEAMKKEQDILERLAVLPDGEQKVKETRRMIGLVRNFIGYREYPKYSMVCGYFVYRQALLKEAEGLVQAGVIPEKEDIYYLSFEELREVVRTHRLDYSVIVRRKEEFKLFEKLSPPRVMTSEGEIVTGRYKRGHLPDTAIPGIPVSSGIIEGRARVILNMEDADLEEGDILVTAFTDPSWTPLFVTIKGLVTEVGGLMTHGAVIAREYGLPAVVGVDNVTRLVKDGQRIRVNGTEGYLEILS